MIKQVFFSGILVVACAMPTTAQQVSKPQELSLSQQIACSTLQPVYIPAATTQTLLISKKRLPFFCRQEVKIEQTLKLPLRLRVGSLEQSNFLEEKTDFVNKGF